MKGIFCKTCQVLIKGNKKSFQAHERSLAHKKIKQHLLI